MLKDPNLVRTDIGFIQKQNSIFAKSLDIGIFLSSLIDLDGKKYKIIEKTFLDGFKSESGNKIPYLSIVVRNISSLAISSNHYNLIMNLYGKINSIKMLFYCYIGGNSTFLSNPPNPNLQ